MLSSSVMTIKQIYNLALEMGINADPRGKRGVDKALQFQKQKYKKLVTACFWGVYAIFAVCIMVFQENVMYGFFSLLFMNAVIFFITTIGSLGVSPVTNK